jgi:ABC-2 type transport system permease protein
MLRAALLIALKDLRILRRDPVALFWTLVFPVAFAVFFGAVWDAALNRRNETVELLTVARSRSPASDALLRGLANWEALKLVPARSEADALRRVRRGQALGYLLLPPDRNDGTATDLRLFFDPMRRQEAQLLADALRSTLERPQNTASYSPGPRLTATALEGAVTRPTSAFDLVFPAAVLWAVMGCAAGFAVGLVTERTRGTFLRLTASPIPRASILAGKALACFTACIVSAGVLVALAVLGFGVHVGSPGGLVTCLFSIAWCFSGITTFLGVLGSSEQAVAGAGWATLILMALLGGAMVPLSAMPTWLVVASDASPIKWAIFALEGAIWRGLSLREVLAPCSVLVGTGMVGFALGADQLAKLES